MESRWEGPFTITRVSKKTLSVTYGIKIKPFNITYVLLIAPKANNTALKHDMQKLQAFVKQNEQLVYSVEVLKPSDLRNKQSARML